MPSRQNHFGQFKHEQISAKGFCRRRCDPFVSAKRALRGLRHGLLFWACANSFALFAQSASDNHSHLSNLVAFVKGELPISKIEFGLNPRRYSQNGFIPTEPIPLETGRQGKSFFIHKTWDVISNKLVTINPGIVWGENATSRWIVSGDTVHFSMRGGTNQASTDPVFKEVEVYKSLAEIGLRMGFPPNLGIGSVNGQQLQITTDRGESVQVDIKFNDQGMVQGFYYRITNAVLTAKVSIEYEYDSGPRPVWMPALVKASAEEIMSNGKRFAYSETNFVRVCQIEEMHLENGFTPEMFFQGNSGTRSVMRSNIWSNGSGIQITGTNVSPILPSDTPSAARETQGSIRIFVIAMLLAISLVFVFFLTRGRKPKN